MYCRILPISLFSLIFYFIFYILATLCGMWDLSSLTLGIEPMAPVLGVQSHNHWTAREVPILIFIFYIFLYSFASFDIFSVRILGSKLSMLCILKYLLFCFVS